MIHNVVTILTIQPKILRLSNVDYKNIKDEKLDHYIVFVVFAISVVVTPCSYCGVK
jgi:hypothetical protein